MNFEEQKTDEESVLYFKRTVLPPCPGCCSAVTRERARPWSWGRIALIYFVAISVLVLGAIAEARCDEPTRFLTPVTCTSDGGTTLRLGPGVYVLEPDWRALDERLRASENAVVGLTAENRALRGYVRGRARWLATALVVGAVVGAGLVFYAEER